MKRLILAVVLLAPLPLLAQDYFKMPVIPDEATKTKALRRAYQLNGCSMVGDISRGTIDVSTEDLNKVFLPDPCVKAPKTDKEPTKGNRQ